MTHDEAELLKPGTLICIREEALADVPEGSALSLQTVAEKDGYIYRFVALVDEEFFPVQAKSLATGADMEFRPGEVAQMEERNDSLLLQVRG